MKLMGKTNEENKTAVVPRVGTWVEILPRRGFRRYDQSSPAWGRGLKWSCVRSSSTVAASSPAWGRGLKSLPAPCCWGCPRSSPAWGRGLKSFAAARRRSNSRSSPAWGRGLKSPREGYKLLAARSSPAWGRGLKWNVWRITLETLSVVPRMGTWVEIPAAAHGCPGWSVVPRVATWVEMRTMSAYVRTLAVVPCVGTCAEISIAPETSSVGLAVGSFPLFAAFKHTIYTSSKFDVFTLTNQALACYNSRCVI